MPSSDMQMTAGNGESRSVSPMTPSPSREVRGLRLFRAISRRLARRSQEDLETDVDSRSCSSDSCGSIKKEADSGFHSISPNHMSSNSSETESDVQVRPRHHHSTSAESIRKVFQRLNLNARSQSCTNTKEITKRKSSKKSTTPKKILRAPATYTYVKGLSGLPTQRIPRNHPRMYSSPCGCSMQYMGGLNR